MLADRRKQATFRMTLCLAVTACYGPMMDWLPALSWAATYAALQLIEACCFKRFRSGAMPGTRATRVAALGLLTLNNLTFGGFGPIAVAGLGSWGHVCAAYLLAGSALNAVLITMGCRAAFYASVIPLVFYFALLPFLVLESRNPPSGLVVLGIGISAMFIWLTAVRLWQAWDAAKRAEIEAIARDLAERTANEGRLFQMAHRDALTGLGNRNVLQTHLTELIGTATPVALLMADLDGFKYINDTLGHSAGDDVLRDIAARVGTSVRAEDIVVRLGGDEFALLLPGVDDPDFAAQIAERVISGVSQPVLVDGQPVNVGVSVGVAFYPRDAAGVEELVSNADLALYAAKGAGRHCHRFYEPHLRAAARNKLSRDDELLRAIERGEFRLLYQPQVRLSDGAITGAEALLRWAHPDEGLLTPDAFLASLESGRLAAQVGRWVINTACQQAATWRAQGADGFRVSVNLFGAQFRSGSLAADVADALTHATLPPDGLELEITENIILRHEDEIVRPLRVLRSRGVGIAFDDYGTGYASLSLLKRYPLSRLKIDQSFVRAVCDSPADAAIMRAIITMARACGLDVIAEGVEKQAQADKLARDGCDQAQGYLFGRPMGASDFTSLLVRDSSTEVAMRA